MEPLHINYRFLLDYLESLGKSAPPGKYLDYGCGPGTIVLEGRNRNLELYGADIFYSEGMGREAVEKLGFLGTIIREIKQGKMDFPDGFFDASISNQVFEHVENLDETVGELARVIKPGGTLFCLFPSKEVWREGHCGIPFFHWFPRGSGIRVYYTWALKCLGFGFPLYGKSRWQWAKHWCDWNDRYTFYRDWDELEACFRKWFTRIEHLDLFYIRYRLKATGRLNALTGAILRFRPLEGIFTGIFRRFGFQVLKLTR